MRWLMILLIPPLIAAVLMAADKAPRLRLTKDKLGKLPAGWKAEKTGKGEGSVWKVVADDSAPSKGGYVLAQTAESPNAVFNICIAEDAKYKDVELAVSFKAIAGKHDQGGGFVWRYQDANNYYICRMNPLEDNYRVYKVVAGKRTQLGGKESVKVKAGEWHKLKVEVKGNKMEGYLDGEKLWEITDDTYQKAGKIGLWTKADAQTYFDDLRVRGD